MKSEHTMKFPLVSGSDGTSRDPFSYRRERVDETLSRPDEICLLNKKRDTITEAICGHYRVVITYMCVI